MIVWADAYERITRQVAVARDAWVRACMTYDDDPMHWRLVRQQGPEHREWLEHSPTGRRVEFTISVRVS